MLRPVTALRSLVFAVFALSACVSSRDHQLPPLPACPAFSVSENQIRVPANGDPIPLTTNRLTHIRFAPGAVPVGTTYNVNAVTREDGEKLAGVGFTGGIAEFGAAVILRISYVGCPDILANEDKRLRIVIKDANGNETSIGGFKNPTEHYVEAYVPHFTDFAIAL